MDNYKTSFDKLCVNPKTEKRSQNIFQLIPETYNAAKKISFMYKIIYLYEPKSNGYEIVAFAIISTPDRFTTILEMLCSYTDKSIRRNGKSLGISLLDDIYSEYVVKQKNVLKIEPATSQLISYYTNWKTPSLPIEWYIQGKTDGYLIYSMDIKSATEEQLAVLVNDVKLFNNLCTQLNIIPNEVLSIQKKEDRKKWLTSKINEINDSRKDQLLGWLSTIDYFTVDEIRDALTHTGGKKHNRRTKRSRRTKRKTKCI